MRTELDVSRNHAHLENIFISETGILLEIESLVAIYSMQFSSALWQI